MKHLKTAIAALVGGLIGATVLWVFQGHSFRLVPEQMSFADLSAIMLSAVSVLVTILGVVIAIVTLWGYTHFKGIAESSARSAAIDHVTSEMEDGKLKQHSEEIVTTFLQKGFEGGKLRVLLEERVDQILISGAAQRARESSAQEDEDDVDL